MSQTLTSPVHDHLPEFFPSEQHFLFEDLDWEAYESFLAGIGDRHIFATYDQGRLELMSPSQPHDLRASLLGVLVRILADESDMDLLGIRSTTLRRQDLQKGLEADDCFYIRNFPRIAGKTQVDLSIDPPPDLAIEIEISRRIINRIPIYEAMGVPEIWCDNGLRVRIMTLAADEHYQPVSHSLSFPKLSSERITEMLSWHGSKGDTVWSRRVRKWIRENLARSSNAE